MAKPPTRLHMVSHTRQGREQYQTYQNWRLQLVNLIDSLLGQLADHPGFWLDGQSILLEDYLEIRPDKADKIAQLVGDGHLQVGPWYVLTDAFLVSPEALIRNLLIGAELVKKFGADLGVGYLPDSSGQIGQMPQILQGFGIENVVVMHGLGDVPLEVWWEAPDTSRVLISYLWNGFPDNWSPDSFKQARDELSPLSSTATLLLMDDNTSPADMSQLIDSVQRKVKGTKIVNSDLQTYFTEIRASDAVQSDSLQVMHGELRSTERFHLSTGALSSRIWLKQRNHFVETLLERWAEPFTAWAMLLDSHTGSEQSFALQSPHGILHHAWRILMENQSYSAIRGCSIDAVQHDLVVRFDHAEQIANTILQKSLDFLIEAVDTGGYGADSIPVVIFNAAGHLRTDLVSVEMNLTPEFHPFKIVDADGNEQPFEAFEEIVYDEGDTTDRPIIIRFLARDMPPYGYRAYSIQPAKNPPEDTIVDEGLTIKNDLLSVTLDPYQGTFTLFDLQTGRSFSDLNLYVDGGDRGDTYTFCPPQRDTLISAPMNTPLHVKRIISPVSQSLEYLQIFRLPSMLSPERDARLPLAAQFSPISVTTRLQITEDVPRVDVDVTVDNAAKDHRLRVHFPTGTPAETALFDGHFEIVHRAVDLPLNTKEWAQQPTSEQPQRAFVTVLGHETGLTIANRGLPEVAVLSDDSHSEIALTLLRCVGWLNRDDLPNRRGGAGLSLAVPGAQNLGTYQFEYSIIPHSSDPLPAWQESWAFQTPLVARVTGHHEGTLKPEGSFVTCDNPRFILSTVKMVENGQELIVRGYSISTEEEQVTLQLALPFSQAVFARLDETRTGEAVTSEGNGRYTFTVRPAEIITLSFGE